MAYCIMRNSKVKAQNGAAVQKHNELSEEKARQLMEDELKRRGVTEISLANLRYNISLTPEEMRGKSFRQRFNEVIAGKLPKKVRKDAVAFINSVYTYSPEATPFLLSWLHANDEKWKKTYPELWAQYEAATQEEKEARVEEDYDWMLAYFKSCKAFMEMQYGVVISAEIHLHESTPHLHIVTIPLVEDKSSETGYKLSAKDLIGNSRKMSADQTHFWEEVGKDFGLERGEPHEPGEAREHQSKEQWLTKQEKKKQKKAKEKTEEYENVYLQMKQDIAIDYEGLWERMENLKKREKEFNVLYKLPAFEIAEMSQKRQNAEQKLVTFEKAVKEKKTEEELVTALNAAAEAVELAEEAADELER